MDDKETKDSKNLEEWKKVSFDFASLYSHTFREPDVNFLRKYRRHKSIRKIWKKEFYTMTKSMDEVRKKTKIKNMKTFNIESYNLPYYSNNNKNKYYEIDIESGDYDYISKWMKIKDGIIRNNNRRNKIENIYGR
jgi:hypothetical protein